MNFFIPAAENEENALVIYNAIKEFARQNLGWEIKDIKIFSIKYRHNGKEYYAEVGKREDFIKELVVAILESNAYLICTTNRGVLRGEPVLVGKEEIISIKFFK